MALVRVSRGQFLGFSEEGGDEARENGEVAHEDEKVGEHLALLSGNWTDSGILHFQAGNPRSGGSDED